MKVEKLKQHCRNYPGAIEELFGPPSNILTYKIGGKNFAYFKTSEPERWRFSLRVSPDRFIELTGVPGVKPARYMGRFHWITIVDVAAFPEDYLMELLQWSYDKAISALPKSKRQQLQ